MGVLLFLACRAGVCVRVCRPPIITSVWEGCFGALVSACERSLPAPRAWSGTSRALPDRIPDLQPCLLTFPLRPPRGGWWWWGGLPIHTPISSVDYRAGDKWLWRAHTNPLVCKHCNIPHVDLSRLRTNGICGIWSGRKNTDTSADFINLRLNRD